MQNMRKNTIMTHYKPALKALEQLINLFTEEIENAEDANLLKSQKGTLQNYKKELEKHRDLPQYKKNKYDFQTDPEHISHIIFNLQLRQQDHSSEYFATKGRKETINQLTRELQ